MPLPTNCGDAPILPFDCLPFSQIAADRERLIIQGKTKLGRVGQRLKSDKGLMTGGANGGVLIECEPRRIMHARRDDKYLTNIPHRLE